MRLAGTAGWGTRNFQHGTVIPILDVTVYRARIVILPARDNLGPLLRGSPAPRRFLFKTVR